MTDTLLTTAQTDTDAGQATESASDATVLTAEAEVQGSDQGSQTTAETETTRTTDDSSQSQDGDDKTKEDEVSDLHGAPETYEDFVIPEGVQADADGIQAFQDLARELDLSQAGAQRLVDFEAARQGRFAEQLVEGHRQQLEQWVNDTKADKEIGGANFEKSSATARLAFKQFGDDAFRSLMEPFDPVKNPTGLGLGNHPALVRVFNRIGKALGEDQPGGSSQAGSMTTAQKLYPSMQK